MILLITGLGSGVDRRILFYVPSTLVYCQLLGVRSSAAFLGWHVQGWSVTAHLLQQTELVRLQASVGRFYSEQNILVLPVQLCLKAE